MFTPKSTKLEIISKLIENLFCKVTNDPKYFKSIIILINREINFILFFVCLHEKCSAWYFPKYNRPVSGFLFLDGSTSIFCSKFIFGFLTHGLHDHRNIFEGSTILGHSLFIFVIAMIWQLKKGFARGLHSTEVSITLLTQLPRVQFSALPRFLL